MRDMESCREEIFRRSHERIRQRKRRQRMALTMCVPLVLCLVVGAVAWPALMGGGSRPPAMYAMPQPGQVDSVWEGDEQPMDAPPSADDAPDDGKKEIYTHGDPREGSAGTSALETVEVEGTDEVLALLERYEGLASPAREGNVAERADGEPICCIIVHLPGGEQRIYYLDGNVLTSEAESWQLVLNEKEEETLRQVLGLPETERS